MTGLDTNVLCRYLLADDSAQTQKASKAIEGASERGDSCYIAKIVLCELVWILESCTSIDRAGIVEILDRLLHAANLEVEDREAAHRALALFKREKGDLADYLIHEGNLSGGCEKTITFDRDLARTPGFEIL